MEIVTRNTQSFISGPLAAGRPAAVIFDLDGTLVDSLADIAGSANDALVQLGYPTHPLASFRMFVGDGIQKLMERSLPAGSSAEMIAGAVEVFRKFYEARAHAGTVLYPGIAGMLDHLAGEGVKLAVLSNKIDLFTKQLVGDLLPEWKFSYVLGERPDVPRKPDPAGAIEIISLLGLKPESVWYLGDTGIDMRTARGASALPIGVTWGYRPREDLIEGGAGVILDRPDELADLFLKC